MSGSRRPESGDFVGAVASGDQRRALEAMRDKLAAAMVEAKPYVVAQIAGRLQAVLKELSELAPPEEGTALDQLATRRRRRLSTSDAAATS